MTKNNLKNYFDKTFPSITLAIIFKEKNLKCLEPINIIEQT